MNNWFPVFQRRHTVAVVALLAAALAAAPLLPSISLAAN